MEYLSQALVKEFQTDLLNRFAQLREDIINALMNSANPKDHLVAQKMETFSCDELLDMAHQYTLSPIANRETSIKSIDAALNNIEIDMYGLCADCENEIEIEQLRINPARQRCLACESKYQKQKRNNFKL